MSILHPKTVTIVDGTNTDLVRGTDWNSAHIEARTLLGNTGNASTVSGSNIQLSADVPLRLVGSNDTIKLQIDGHGMNYEQIVGTNVRAFANQSSLSLGQNSVYLTPVLLERPLSAGVVKLPVLVTNSSSAASSGNKAITFQVGAYSRLDTAQSNTGYSRLTRIWSSSYTMQASYSSNASWGLSMITAVGNSTSYNTTTASSAGINLSSSLHGARYLILPVSSTFPPGEYWMAVHQSTSAVAGTVGNVLNISNLVATYLTGLRPGLIITSNQNQTAGWGGELLCGVHLTTQTALPATIDRSQISVGGTMILGMLGQDTQ